MHRLLLVGLAWLLGHACGVGAQDFTVPAQLRPWESWVLYGEEFRRCPLHPARPMNDPGAFACAWPGRMRIAVSAQGGEFSQRWRLYADSWVILPGDEQHWPEDVRVDGRAAAVVPHEGLPRLRLAAGDHAVSGRFIWSRRPQALRVPSAMGLVELSIDGKPVAPVELRHDRLWLGAVRSVAAPRALHVQVYRLLEDDIPLRLVTRLQLKVSGDAREELLAAPLPEGFVPTAASGALPVRFEPDGRLRVQVRSGEHVLTISARAVAPTQSVVAPTGQGPWAAEEIWSYRSNDRLRITAAEAAHPVDPGQAGVPLQWRELPAFRIGRGELVTLAQRSRGLSGADANRLALQRTLWLGFDRQSFLVADRISGSMQQGWRLDMSSPYSLLSARQGEETLLITDGAAGRTGIEIRTPTVEVTTLSRVPRQGAQPVTGWDTRFERAEATVHLPPGHRLLGGWGVDEAPDAWLNQWQLLDLFLLMLVAVAAFRLLGWAGAAMAAGAIVLTQHETYAPAWLWVNLFVAIALARVVPEGRLRRWTKTYQVLSFAGLLLALVPFAVTQYRLAIYPQLQVSGPFADAFAPEPAGGRVMKDSVEASAPLEQRALSSKASMPEALYAPDVLLQTGPGIPDWEYLTYQLRWNGSVDASQTVRLVILPPLWLALWRIAGVLLSAALLAALLRIAYPLPPSWRLPSWRSALPVLAFAAVLISAVAPPRAAAQTPDASVLAELKKRLTQPAKCVPDCTQVVSALLVVRGERLSVQMEIHAQANAAVGVPQAGPQWMIESISVDGRLSEFLAREGEQLQLPLASGVHRIEVSGPVVQANELSLEFPQPPRRLVVSAQGWDVSGLSDGRLLNSALQLTRRAGKQEVVSVPQRFAPFVRIHRRLSMNLDWTVSTVVERIAPQEGAFTLRLPLLPGEAVLTPGLEVRDGMVLVSMPAAARSAQWESSLPVRDKLQWRAAVDQPWVERWDVVVSPIWHVEFEGTPAILPQESANGMWINEFLPQPGEVLELTVTRPAASAGTTLAVDRVELTTVFRQRLSDSTLRLTYRTSQGGRHDLRIPSRARVQSVSLDGQSSPVRPTAGVLPLTLTPGRHQLEVSFSEDTGVGLASRPARIDVGVEGTNVHTSVVLAENRWVLFAWGEGVGPAILYWGELLVFALVAIGLGRLRRGPLSTRDWFFLGLGLSTFSWWVLLVFGTWIFVLDARERWQVQGRWHFNAVQVMLALVSLAVLGMLISAIPYGLLGQPDMGIRSGASAYARALSWFLDRSGPQLSRPTVISVSIWYYKLAMLVWALWLSFALLRWLPWAWQRYTSAGLWKGKLVGQ